MEGDIDNIVKLVLDAMSHHIYMDDAQVERVVVQKFEPGRVFGFSSPSEVLASAMFATKPVLYIRLSDNPFEDLS
jgi:crossover junction endodeoxyribonuclease RusA